MAEPLRTSGGPGRRGTEPPSARLERVGSVGAGRLGPQKPRCGTAAEALSSAEEKRFGPEGVPGEPRRSDGVGPNGLPQDEPW